MMKYKEGDKVVIRKDLVVGENYRDGNGTKCIVFAPMVDFAKSDLKSGMVVEVKCGHHYLYIEGRPLMNVEGTTHLPLVHNEELKFPYEVDFDIVKVFKFTGYCFDDLKNNNYLELLWERQEKVIQNQKDKKKSDLEGMMLLETRKGDKMLYTGNSELLDIYDVGWTDFNEYKDDLLYEGDSGYDIMAIYKFTGYRFCQLNEMEYYKEIWKRED